VQAVLNVANIVQRTASGVRNKGDMLVLRFDSARTRTGGVRLIWRRTENYQQHPAALAGAGFEMHNQIAVCGETLDMTSRGTLKWLMPVGVVLIVVCLGINFLWPHVRITPAEVEQMIDNGVRPRSTPDEVIEFLDKQGIDHTEYTEGPDPIRAPRTLEDLKPTHKRFVHCKIPNTRTRLLLKWDIFVTFYFDDERRLVSHRVWELGTGP